MKSRGMVFMFVMAVMAAILLQPLRQVLGCGPFFEPMVFTNPNFPDPPYENFAA